VATVPPWRWRLPSLSNRGYAGGVIRQHRAMIQLHRTRSGAVVGFALPVAFTLLQVLLLGPTLELWRALIGFWSDRLGLGLTVSERSLHLGELALTLPHLSGLTWPPAVDAWWPTFIVCLLLLLATYLVRPIRWLPLIYAVRATIFLQATGLAVFALAPASFPFTAEDHVNTGLLVSLLLLFLVPWFLGLTYYVFDFPLHQKLALTLVVLGYFTLAAPMQYLLHIYLLERLSLLLLPVLYLLFGLLLDVLLLVALYAWGVSWRFRATERE